MASVWVIVLNYSNNNKQILGKNEFNYIIIFNINIFNIILILFSDKESFYFGTLCTKHKEQKKKLSWVTFAFGDKK